MKLLKNVLLFLLAGIAILVIGFVIYGYTPARSMPEAARALLSDETVKVSTGKWLVFQPVGSSTKEGFIFYPGARVDYRAYAPMAKALAEKGILVVVVRMPLNLAVFGINKADAVMQAYPEIGQWMIGGHSLGGAMAADYLAKHRSLLDGLILLAAYPPSNDLLSDYAGVVCSISGSNDGLATPTKIQASKALLPVSTRWLVIEGGNHAYFGWYGPQKGDNPATITREEQQTQIVEDALACLTQVQ